MSPSRALLTRRPRKYLGLPWVNHSDTWVNTRYTLYVSHMAWSIYSTYRKILLCFNLEVPSIARFNNRYCIALRSLIPQNVAFVIFGLWRARKESPHTTRWLLERTINYRPKLDRVRLYFSTVWSRMSTFVQASSPPLPSRFDRSRAFELHFKTSADAKSCLG